jgi:hypothetical protein
LFGQVQRTVNRFGCEQIQTALAVADTYLVSMATTCVGDLALRRRDDRTLTWSRSGFGFVAVAVLAVVVIEPIRVTAATAAVTLVSGDRAAAGARWQVRSCVASAAKATPGVPVAITLPNFVVGAAAR